MSRGAWDTADWRAREALVHLWDALKEMPLQERKAFLRSTPWLPGTDVDAMLDVMLDDERRLARRP